MTFNGNNLQHIFYLKNNLNFTFFFTDVKKIVYTMAITEICMMNV